MELGWTNSLISQLIEEYKKRPELWDRNHEQYRVQSAKYEAWHSLARMFGCEIVDIKKKLNSISASRRREKAKIRAGGVSTWQFYDQLKFLTGHIDKSEETHEQAVSKLPHNEDEPMSDDDDAEEQEEEVVIKQEPVQVFTSKLAPPRAVRRLPRPLRRTHTHHTHHTTDTKLLELLKLLRKSELSKKKDECDIFGEYIASSLRKHDERTRSMIKQAINNILFEQEMKKYSTPGQYTVMISEQPDNPLTTVHIAEDILGDTHQQH